MVILIIATLWKWTPVLTKNTRKMWLKSFDTARSLQANLGWTWEKIAWANYVDKSRKNVFYNTKTIGNVKLGPTLRIPIDKKVLIKLRLINTG